VVEAWEDEGDERGGVGGGGGRVLGEDGGVVGYACAGFISYLLRVDDSSWSKCTRAAASQLMRMP
jgi:hypothetical protein